MTFALDYNPTPSEVSGAINYLLANFSPGLSADPVTGQVSGPTGTVLSYLYKYLAVKYADSADGAVNFSDYPTGREYYGLRNTDDSTESTNPADYIWTKVAGGFGTTKFLWYQTGGGRQVDFAVDTVAPNSYFIQADVAAIDLDVVTGNNGMMFAMPSIYAWTSTSTPPTRPTTTSTYTWATGAISSVPSGWYSSIPAMPSGASYLWQIVIPLIESINVTTSTLDWTNTSYPITAIAANGSTGPRTTTGYLYYQLASLTTPTTPTASGFNYVTGQFTTLTANWSTNFNAPSATDTTKFWACYYSVSESTFGGVQTVTISSPFNWTNFNGLVTFTNLATSSGTTFIDGGNITTGTLSANTLYGGQIAGYGSNYVKVGTSFSGNLLFVNSTSGSLTAPPVFFNDTSGGSYQFFDIVTNSKSGSNNAAIEFNSGATGAIALIVNQTGSSGGAAQFFNSPSSKQFWAAPGSYSAYSPSGGGKIYIVDGNGPFTGFHDLLVEKTITVEIGDLIVDESLFYKKDISNTLFVGNTSSSANQKRVVGIVSNVRSVEEGTPGALWNVVAVEDGDDIKNIWSMPDGYDPTEIENTYNVIQVNALGEGQVNVCGENGDIQAGDLIVTSSIPGKGMKQSDDLVRSITVAKSRETVTFSSSTEVKQIACIYLGG